MNSEKIDIASVGNVELLKRLRNRTLLPYVSWLQIASLVGFR